MATSRSSELSGRTSGGRSCLSSLSQKGTGVCAREVSPDTRGRSSRSRSLSGSRSSEGEGARSSSDSSLDLHQNWFDDC